MRSESTFQCCSCEAPDVPGISRALQTMEENDLTASAGSRLMFVGNYCSVFVNDVLSTNGRGQVIGNRPSPEISSDRGNVRVAEKRSKLRELAPSVSRYWSESLFRLRSSERMIASANSRIGRRSLRLSLRKRR